VTATTRRGALAAAGAAALAVRAGDAAARASNGDRAVLGRLIVVERSAAVAYEQAAGAPSLSSRERAVARDFGAQEREHVAVLGRALEGIGGRPPSGDPAPADVRVGAKALAEVRERADVLGFLLGFELETVRLYYEAHQRLGRGALLRTTGAIMGNEGQHLAVLRQALGRDPIPTAFETGR